MNKLYSAFFFIILTGMIACKNGELKKPETSEPDTPREVSKDALPKSKTIIFFGNSLTAGYGVDPSEAFPALIQGIIDSLGLQYKVVNAGVSGETTAGGNSRIDWVLHQPVDVFVLELGGNDGLRGISPAETKKNLQTIINKVRSKYPGTKIVLAGMQIPPNMGQRYTGAFKQIYPDLAKENNITLIPFLLDHVGGDPALNQPDGIHPTASGHKIVAENVWKELKGIL
ncbi:MAG: arylesterase [Bacteroidetes bacterium]|nr:arylesterase [Bacteroidota bacterium]